MSVTLMRRTCKGLTLSKRHPQFVGKLGRQVGVVYERVSESDEYLGIHSK